VFHQSSQSVPCGGPASFGRHTTGRLPSDVRWYPLTRTGWSILRPPSSLDICSMWFQFIFTTPHTKSYQFVVTSRFMVTVLNSILCLRPHWLANIPQLTKLNLSLMLWPTVSWPVCLGIKHPSGVYDQIFITVKQLRVCWCGTLSLTRERICHLQLLLALAITVIFGSKSCATHYILLSQIRDLAFHRLIQVAGLLWKYSILPPHGILTKLELSLMLWPTVSRPVWLGIKHPLGAYDQNFITVRQLRVSWCGALSLTRGRVCWLQLLLALASAVIFRSESRGTRDHVLLSQIRDPFMLPPTTRRATVELFDPASTQDTNLLISNYVPLITSRHGPRRNHHFSLLKFNYCCGNKFVCEVVTQQRLPYICLFRGRCLARGVVCRDIT
jgi:hypothetical protein